MRSSFATRLVLALAVVAALCGFKFLRHHITQAPIIDNTAPFFGSGLVIGPEETLPGVFKRAPLKFRMYKFLKRLGDTQYVPGLRREADCSLTEVYADLADYTIATTRSNFQNRLRSAAGLDGPANSFPQGCIDQVSGIGGRSLVGGRLAAGGYYGAGPDFHADTAIVLYRSDGTTIVDHHDIELAPEGSNQYVGFLAIGDFNGDSHPDYAVALSAYGDGAIARIAVLLGDGAGAFGSPTYATVATAPAGSGKSASATGMTVADFDGDSKLDLAVSTNIGGSSSSIVFLKGHGDGTFDPAMTVANDVGFDVIAADFNDDGKLDIASGDGYLLFGNGAGGFNLAPGQRFDAGSLAAGDFDNDGKLDLAIEALTGDGSPIHIWRGDGTGQFTRIDPGYGTGYGSGTSDLIVTDLDGDGNADVVVGSSGDGLYGPSINSQAQTQFLLGRGDGTLASPPYLANAVAAIADFDSDGKPDLLALDTSTQDHGVRPLLGDGHGGFHAGAFSSLGFNFYEDNFQAWLAVDLDGDGKADLVATQSSFDTPPTSVLHTRLGNGDGTFHGSGADMALGFGLSAFGYTNGALPAAADFTGDGKIDLAVIGYGASGSGVYLLAGNGNGTFAAPATIDATLASTSNPPGAVLARDFDNDGKPDLVAMDTGRRYDNPSAAGSVRVYRNLGGGSFATPITLAGAPYPEGLAVGDVNGDGKADVVVTAESAAYSNDTLYVYLGIGDGTFQAARTQVLLDFWFESIALGDADNDGKLDLVIGNCCGLTFASYAKGDGSGGFATPAILPLTVSPQLLMLADLTGSGHPDLIVQSGYSTTPDVRVFMNAWKDAIFANGFESQ